MLIERGHHPLMARGLSHWMIRSGKEEANKAKMQRIVVDAVRFLANPGGGRARFPARRRSLLQIGNTSSNLGDVFDGGHISVFEFIEALEGAVRGDLAACQRVTEVAAVLAPGLSVRRGPKASVPSIAHELLLTYVAERAAGPKGYTYSFGVEDYTDPLTRATRLAFGDPDFDPCPARRRQRKRLGLKSN